MKQGPCRMREGHWPLRIYSLLLQLGNTLHATTHEQGKFVQALHLDILLLCQNYFFFDSLQYDFSLTWNKIPFHACAYWGVRGVGVQGGSVKNAFIPTENKKRVSSGKKTGLKTQHGQDPSSGQGIALDLGKISTKQQGCHSTSTKNWECTHRVICCFPAKPWAFTQPLNIR